MPCLDALHQISEIAAVISQPDRPAGRGLSMRPPAVKKRALELGLEVWQPTKVRTAELASRLRALEADVAVVVAYGRILPRAVLDAPRLGCVNVHASLLPRWRGAAPIQWAIAHGDRVTGVTLMQMDEGMDTGAILAMESTPIRSADDAESLGKRLSEMGAKLLQTQLPRYVAGEIAAEEQDENEATMAPLLTKDHGRIDWNRPAEAVHDQVRGMNPWPGAHTALHGRRIKVHRTLVSTLDPEGAPPGQVIALGEDGILVACGQGTVAIQELQESGRKRVDARAFATGRGISVGDRFSNEGIEE